MLKSILEKLKSSKVLIGIILLLLLGLTFYYDNKRLRDQEQLPPVDFVVDIPSLNVLGVTPSELPNKSLDPFSEVVVEFDHPVDASSIEVDVTPPVELAVFPAYNSPEKLTIMPKGGGWEHYVKYTITIRSAKGVNGQMLETPYRVLYENVPPTLSPEDIPF